MGTSEGRPGEMVKDVDVREDVLAVDLVDGRTIVVPLAWYPRLLHATPEQRARWEICGGGFGIHWPDVDEDLSTEGLLRGAPAPNRRKATGRDGLSFGDGTRNRSLPGTSGSVWTLTPTLVVVVLTSTHPLLRNAGGRPCARRSSAPCACVTSRGARRRPTGTGSGASSQPTAAGTRSNSVGSR